MIRSKLMKRTILIGPVLAALLGAGIVLGCTSDTGIVDGRDSGNRAVRNPGDIRAGRRRIRRRAWTRRRRRWR